MAQVVIGNLTVTLADELTPPESAGKLSDKEVLRLPKTPQHIKRACFEAAESVELAGSAFVWPFGITPDSLRLAGSRAEDLDASIAQAEYAVKLLKQAKLLNGAEALRQLGEVNDQAQTQAKRRPQLWSFFSRLVSFFSRPRKEKEKTTAPTTPAEPVATTA